MKTNKTKIGCGKEVWSDFGGKAKTPKVQTCGTKEIIVAQLPVNIRLKVKDLFYCDNCKKKLKQKGGAL